MGNVVNSMADSIADAMSQKTKQVQLEMQDYMLERSFKTMCKSQDRQMRSMQAMQMAFARDLVYWYGGVFATVCTGVTAYTFKTKKFPIIASIPLFAIGTILAYQIDFAYGNKANRVNKIKQDILKEKHWFVPIVPTPEEVNKLK